METDPVAIGTWVDQLLTWIEQKPNILLVLTNILLVLVTAVYAALTRSIARANRQMVAAMQEQSKTLNRPYIVVSAFIVPKSAMFYLKIENAGKTSARNLQLTIDKSFYRFGRAGEENNLARLNVFNQVIRDFPPGSQLVFPLAQHFVVLGEDAKEELTPRLFNITAGYCALGERVTETTNIDLNMFFNSQYEPDPVVDRLEKMVQEIEKGVGSLGSLASSAGEISALLRDETNDESS
jgi:hypothetical protein